MSLYPILFEPNLHDKDRSLAHKAYCPELDLVGYDYTEEEAKKSWLYKANSN